MRVNRSGGDDRGAVLPIVAVFTVVAVIFLAFVIDFGNQRQDRRQLTTATDAAALDVAQEWADNSLEPLSTFTSIDATTWNCSADALDYLDRNRTDDSGSYNCTAEIINGQLGSVTVFSDGQVDFALEGVTGQDSGQIASSSSVRIGSTEGGGLRPWAVCARDQDVTNWFNAGGTTVTEITLGGDKFLPSECGQNNANWGFVQFETQANGQKSLAEIIREGSPDPTASFDNGDQGNPVDPYADEKAVCVDDADENPQTLYDEQDPVTCLFNSTGAAGWNNNNALDAFDYLRDEQIVFSVPLYGEIQPIGAGQLTGFPIIGFAEVQLVWYNPAQGSDNNEMRLRFLKLSTGDCCDVNESNQTLALCDVGTRSGSVGDDFDQVCQTSDATSGGPGNSVPPGSQPCDILTVSPAFWTVTLKSAPPSDKDKLPSDIKYDVTVADADDCGVITAEAVPGNGASRGATVTGPVGDVYEVTFLGNDAKYKAGTTYVIEVSNDGVVENSDAELRTT